MKLQQIAQFVVVLLAASAVFLFVRTAEDAELRRTCTSSCALGPNYAGRNRTAPDFELPALGGKHVKLSDYRGKVVLLNFWTKTCRPCLEEMPSLAELTQSLKAKKDVVVLTISTDESLEDAQATLDSVLGAPAPFAVMIDPDRAVVTDRFGTKLFPETWFIDAQGVIRARVDGARDWSDALVVDFVDAVADPVGCAIDFSGGQAKGPLAGLCTDLEG